MIYSILLRRKKKLRRVKLLRRVKPANVLLVVAAKVVAKAEAKHPLRRAEISCLKPPQASQVRRKSLLHRL